MKWLEEVFAVTVGVTIAALVMYWLLDA